MKEVSEGEIIRAATDNQFIRRDRTGWVSGCEVVHTQNHLSDFDPTGPRWVGVRSGEVRVDGSTLTVEGASIEIPTAMDPQIVSVIVVDNGDGTGMLTTTSGRAEPLSDSLESVNNDWRRLESPSPAETTPNACQIAQILTIPAANLIEPEWIVDARVPAIPPGGGSGGDDGGGTVQQTPPTAQPGEVQSTLDSVAEGQTVQLDSSADYSTSGDFPWLIKNKTLDGNGVSFQVPNDVRSAINFLPLTYGVIKDMTIDVSPDFSGEFIVGSDLPADFPEVSGGKAGDLDESIKRYGVPVMYSNRRVAHDININGPSLQYFRFNDTDQPPNCAGLYIHEQGSGYGVQEWEVSTRGLDRGIHIFAEGDTDDTNDTYGGGFINSNWFRGSHTFHRNHIRLECTGGSGINRNRFEVRLQPDDHMSEHFIHATCSGDGPGAPTIEENSFAGEFWDPQKFAEFADQAIRWDGSEVTNNVIRHSNDLENYILDENEEPLEDAIVEQNGASGNETVKEKTLGKLYETASSTGLKFGYRLNSPNGIDLTDIEPNQIFWSANPYNQHLEAQYNQDDGNGWNVPRTARVTPSVSNYQAADSPSTDGSAAREVLRCKTDNGAGTLTIASDDEMRNASKTIVCDGSNTLTVESANGTPIIGENPMELEDGETLHLWFMPNSSEWVGLKSGGPTPPGVVATGQVSLTDGAATVDTGVSVDTGSYYDVRISPQAAGDVAASIEHNGSSYSVHIEENTTENNPAVAFQLVQAG